MKRVFLTVVACSCFGIAISQTATNKKTIKPYDWNDRNNNTIYRSDSSQKRIYAYFPGAGLFIQHRNAEKN